MNQSINELLGITSIITIDIENGLIWGYNHPYFSDPVMTYIPTYDYYDRHD